MPFKNELVKKEYGIKWVEKHRDEVLAYQKKYRLEHADERRKSLSAWYKRNKERADKQKAEWRAKNPEKVKAYKEKYNTDHPEKTREISQTRRACIAGAPGTYLAAEWLQTLKDFDHRCAYCSRGDRPLTQDHIVPISKGGRHDSSNIVPACKSCNSKKSTKSLLIFLLERWRSAWGLVAVRVAA